MKALLLPLDRKTFIPIDREEAMRMVKAGTAEAYGTSTPYAYREVKPSPKAQAPEDLDSVEDEEPTQTYATRDMAAAPKPAPKPKPRKPRTSRYKPSVKPTPANEQRD